MDSRLGLSRDPFAESVDNALFWESEARATLRREATALLDDGRSVWLRGPEGTGRRTLLNRIAVDLVADGIPVAVAEGRGDIQGREFLNTMATVVGTDPSSPDADLLSLAEQLYRRLVEVFCAARPAVLIVPWELPGEVEEEAGILAALRLVGRPLVAVAAMGSGAAPTAEFTTFSLPQPDPEDLRECLGHRCAAAGRVDLFPPATLTRLIAGSPTLAVALARARTELQRLAFEAALGEPRQEEAQRVSPVLDAAQVQEVDRLLRDLSAESPVS